ncbi:hypothetical protein E2562_019503 [Oryza meyeriana var. granulata]|uniref:Uncharacterized protein n=1 Tax=Oryza meyeriana var. granulata TaxID=110450 RepID=A0A6G1DJD1_9ORYZ|nr:hypothetical protein E2562_019503 [Oryza meyeriana var. granulata]
MESPLPIDLAASQTSAKATASSGSHKRARPAASENASQNLGMSASSAAPASAPSSERILVPSGGTGTGGTETDGVDPIDVDAGSDGEDENEPASKRAKKSTSEVWQYFTKYTVTMKVNGKEENQLWAKCNVKGSKNISSLPSDLEVLEAIKNSLLIEDEFLEMGGDYVLGDDDDMPEVQL